VITSGEAAAVGQAEIEITTSGFSAASGRKGTGASSAVDDRGSRPRQGWCAGTAESAAIRHRTTSTV